MGMQPQQGYGVMHAPMVSYSRPNTSHASAPWDKDFEFASRNNDVRAILLWCTGGQRWVCDNYMVSQSHGCEEATMGSVVGRMSHSTPSAVWE